MASMVKSLFGGSVKQLTCCISPDFQKEPRKPQESEGLGARMRPRWSSEEQHQRSLEEEKRKRDAFYAQKKAERAVMRDQLRQKYQLPKDRTVQQQRRSAGSNVKLSKEVMAVVKPEEAAENELSFFGTLPSFQNLDLSFLRKTAQSTMGPQCLVM